MSRVLPLDPALVRAGRRFWPAALALALLVGVVSGVQFALTPRHYTASQDLRVAVLPVAGSGASDTESLAASAAAALGAPSTLGSSELASAILIHLGAGEQGRLHLTPVAVEHALSGAHRGSDVSLSATWITEDGAQEILAAAATSLQANPIALTSSGQNTVFADTTVRVQTDSAGSRVTRTPGEESAALTLLIERLGLGLVAAALLLIVLSVLEPYTATTPTPAPVPREE